MSKYVLPVNISTLKLTKLRIAILFIGAQIMLSCDSDDKEITCRILTVDKWAHAEEYIYNTKNKVETVRFHSADYNNTGKLEYNAAGQLAKFTVYDDTAPDKPIHIHELVYDGEKKPQKSYYWSRFDDPSNRPSETVHFFHDEKGRLVNMIFSYFPASATSISRRFEYNSDDNVSKMFLAVGVRPEVLTDENLSFDNKPRLYDEIPELATLDIYIDRSPPGKNNVLTGKFHFNQTTVEDVTYEAGYDDNGLIISYVKKSSAGNFDEFFVVKRECK